MLQDLYRHMEWADAEVWRAVLASPAAGEDAVIREKLHHIHLVQRGFLDGWRGQKPKFRELPELESHEATIRWARENHRLMQEHVAAARNLDDVFVVPWQKWIEEAIGGKPGPTTYGESMLQVVMHSLYHRGQVNTRLREVGAVPPLVDYIAWLWRERPAPRWP
jgi:uncharacterized damage-inducible protein DinB